MRSKFGVLTSPQKIHCTFFVGRVTTRPIFIWCVKRRTLQTVIQSKGSKAKDEYIEDKENENFIELFLNNYCEHFDIFPACGDLVQDDLFEKYVNQIDNCKNQNKKEIWSFAPLTIKKGRPRHVSPKARYNMKLLKKFMENEIKKQPLEIKSGILKEVIS